ncbi:MAG: PKD domain-containing protein [Cryomorphaceae bacterium]
MDSLPILGRVFQFDVSTRYTTPSVAHKSFVALMRITDNTLNSRIMNTNASANGIFFTPEGVNVNFSGSGAGDVSFVESDLSPWIILIVTGEIGMDNYIRINGNASPLTSESGFLEGVLRIGIPSNAFTGYLKEFILYDRFISQTEASEIENYFFDKYTDDINLGADITTSNFCPIKVGVSDRFVNPIWNSDIESDSLVITKSGAYSVEANDIFGRTYRDTIQITFPGEFISTFQICSNRDSLWTTNLEAFEVEWQDGTTTTDYLIEEAGEYFLTVTDSEGCTYTSETVVVTEDLFPNETELNENPNFCLGNDLFLSSGFAEAESYLWSTGEGAPFIQPQISGEYWVEATNGNGCVGQDTVQIDIVGVAPLAEFGFSPPCEENDVVFDDLTVPEGGTITDWNWTFENNAAGSSTDENPEILYPSTGSYPVELTVTLDNGCTGTTRDTITVNPLPLVNFSAPIVCAGNEVFFESQSGVPGNGTIALREWSFGNGTTDVGSIGSTTFETLGFTTVTHTVTTEDACVDSLVRNVEVLGSPIVDFDVEDVCIGQTVSFNENVDTSVSGPIFYNWQFGDGFFSNFPNTSHEYSQAGVYQVTLTATGNNIGANGCVDQETKEIRVYEPPTAEATASDACIGGVTELVDNTDWVTLAGEPDPVIARTWNIVDGPTGNQEGFIGTDSVQTFIPAAAGTFDVLLETETASGCAVSTTESFLVQAIPSAAFTLTLPTIDPPFTGVPENLTEDGINYQWLINGAVVSSAFEPTLTFESAGEYAVWLVATNDLDCNDTAKAVYTVIVPEYDIELLDLAYQTQGNSLILNAIISNNSNVAVEVFDTEVNVGRDIQFTVESEVTIAPGDIIDYPLGSEIGYLPGRDLPYTCMRISNPNGAEESDTTNNYLCIGLNQRRATFAAPYPNPAKDEVKLTFVVPDDGPLNVEITAADGRAMESFVLELKEGLNTVDYPLIGWAEGMYFFKFSFRNQEEVHRLVVAR